MENELKVLLESHHCTDIDDLTKQIIELVMPKIADIKGLVEQVEILFSYYDKDGEAKFSKDHFGSRLWIDTTRNYVEKIKSNFTV